MFSRAGFTLTEILIGMVLTGIVILAVVSVDITSRRFLQAARGRTHAQDEVKIAMAHVAKNAQLGIGDINNPGFTPGGGGTRLDINQDIDGDGVLDPGIRYTYRGAPNFDILYDPDITSSGDEETVTSSIISSCNFAIGSSANVVEITIISRPNPAVGASVQNPETTLTSSVALRAMSTN